MTLRTVMQLQVYLFSVGLFALAERRATSIFKCRLLFNLYMQMPRNRAWQKDEKSH